MVPRRMAEATTDISPALRQLLQTGPPENRFDVRVLSAYNNKATDLPFKMGRLSRGGEWFCGVLSAARQEARPCLTFRNAGYIG